MITMVSWLLVVGICLFVSWCKKIAVYKQCTKDNENAV